MTSTVRAGRGLKGQSERDAAEAGLLGAARGLSTGDATEAIATSSATMLIAALSTPRRPFIAQSITVRGSDAGTGQVYVSLYRIARTDLTATGWTARKSFTKSQSLPAAAGTVHINLDEPKSLDPQSVWLIGLRTQNALATIRGTNTNTPPGFEGWSIAAVDPDTLVSTGLTKQRLIPSVQLLSLVGHRLRV